MSIASVSIRRKELKLLAVEYLGGKCIQCGYDKCIEALDFHHRDNHDKLFAISKNGNTKSWEIIIQELNKCDLLCANCHREEHVNMTILSEVLDKRKRAETLREKPKCIHCGNERSNSNLKMFCSRNCFLQFNTKHIPDLDTLMVEFKKYGSVLAMSRVYGVSDQAIRNWFDHHGALHMVKRKSRPQTSI